ncbi:hypothetical protein NMY22_g19986 [Coprinellus aureogranulatus]|nr:hypothetical protein NMY22_g19986 [Coprinellus aureogranulatus]
MRLFTTSSLVLALLFTKTVDAGRFEECLDRVRSGGAGVGRIGATDNKGNILDDPRNAAGLTYGLCVEECGGEAAPFRWPDFSKQLTDSRDAAYPEPLGTPVTSPLLACSKHRLRA